MQSTFWPGSRAALRASHAWIRGGYRTLRLAACLAAAATLALAGTDFERLSRLARERYGEAARARVERWRDLTLTQAEAADEAKLEATNEFFNRQIQFDDDLSIWNQRDYWATPLETLGVRRGDCEDISVAKYATLLVLGIPVEKLRLVYVKASIGGPESRVTQAHMVLAYYAAPDSEPLILDNLVEQILPARRRPDLHPIFSFNSAGLWVGSERRSRSNTPTSRLSRWQDVLQRMHADGLDRGQENSP